MTDPTPSTPTSTMKEAEDATLLREAARLVDEYGLNCAAMKDRDESGYALRSRMELLAFIRSLVEAQPSAVAGEAGPAIRCVLPMLERAMKDYAFTGDKAGEVLAAMNTLRRLAAPSAVLPLKGEVPPFDASKPCDRQRMLSGALKPGDPLPTMCERCHNPHHACDSGVAGEGAAAPSDMDYGNNMNIEVAAPVETEQPTEAMQLAGAQAIRFDTTPLNKLWTANAVWKAMLAARPLPGGVPTGLPTEAIEDAASVLRHIGPQLNAEWAHRCARAAAALSAGDPSSLQGERK